jgi:hypothetical protein
MTIVEQLEDTGRTYIDLPLVDPSPDLVAGFMTEHGGQYLVGVSPSPVRVFNQDLDKFEYKNECHITEFRLDAESQRSRQQQLLREGLLVVAGSCIDVVRNGLGDNEDYLLGRAFDTISVGSYPYFVRKAISRVDKGMVGQKITAIIPWLPKGVLGFS